MGEEPQVQPENEEPVDIVCLEHDSWGQAGYSKFNEFQRVHGRFEYLLWHYLALRPVLLLSRATAVTVKEYGLARYSFASSLLR